MKNILTAAFAAAVLLAAPSAFAAPAANPKGLSYSPAAQGPAYYGGYDHGYRSAYDRGPRPGYRAPYYRPAGYYRAPAPIRYAPGPRYGYVPAPPVYPQPQPRRPAAVAIRIHL